MRKIILLFVFIFSAHAVFAQKQVVLEKIRCFSSNRPVADYLEDADIRKVILAGLYQTLQKQQHLFLTDTTKAKIQFLDFNFVVPRIQPDYKDADTSRLHLYFDILEMDPFYFFRSPDNAPSDTTMPKRAKAVFTLTSWLLDVDKKIKETNTLTIVISPAETPGLGILYNQGIRFSDLAILPKVFVQFLRVGTDILFDPKSEVSLVEMKLQPAYFTDNYILTKTFGQPRTFVVYNKNIGSYHLGNKTEMIRLGDPLYEKVMLKGKKAQKYPPDITQAIKRSEHFLRSDYVFLRQDCRDVLRDKNYLVKLAVEVDPNSESDGSSLLTNFIPGNFHYLLNDNDTVARFSIQKNFPGKNQLYSNIIYNGYDSLSSYKIKMDFPFPVPFPTFKLSYNYVIEGRISNTPFTIKCSGLRNTIKEIYLNNKLACIAQGKFTIEKFVVFDASLSSELLNQLFMIGFNQFLE